ncbi:MAG: DUF4920 domain-containing protein [Flavobacteriales bacterium]|nr:DUF4920 domain-containing protein [Flavobacteriales bacterium]
MKKILTLLSLSIIYSCSNQEKPVEVKEEIEVIVTKHGKDITEDGALTAAEFLSKFNGKDSLQVKLMAPITDVCQKKGCWMTLDLGNDLEMRVSFKDYEFFVPKDASGRMAFVEGIARIDTTSVEELKHYLKDAEASQEEIDAVKEPEINYSFEADGVLIKEEKLTKGDGHNHEEDHGHEH